MFPALENIRVPTFDKRASREECSRIVQIAELLIDSRLLPRSEQRSPHQRRLQLPVVPILSFIGGHG
jgi:hypothetical protein